MQRVAAGGHVRQWNEQGGVGGGAASFDHFDRNAAHRGPQPEPQRRRRGFAGAGHRTHEPEPGIGGLRREIEPAQRLRSHVGLPQHDRAAAAVFEDLLGGPQGVAGAGRAYPQQPAGVDTQLLECIGLRQIGRLHQGDALALRQPAQNRLEQLELANA